MSGVDTITKREFTITVLGRTLEHLGIQMYKRRDAAIAELVANSWDADAKKVEILVPEQAEYDPATSAIFVTDDGSGMEPDDIQDHYLVIGRNARKDETRLVGSRPIMGRKGIGKLAGFGLASRMLVVSWRDDICTELEIDVAALKKEDGVAATVPLEGIVGEKPSFSDSVNGTRIVLRQLKHKSYLPPEALRNSLARRFTRTIREEMTILVNGVPVGDPAVDFNERFPATGYEESTLSDGSCIRYFYGFATKPITSAEMRGFTIFVRGKTAQAPPFYFRAEATASGPHATKYLSGSIEADYLDEGSDDESDIISTDRQELDWESDAIQPFKEWGDKMVRDVFRIWSNRKGDRMENWISEDEDLTTRVERLDKASRQQVRTFIRTLGGVDADRERSLELADSLVRAFEYRHFHDVINEIESAADDPDSLQQLLLHLKEWKVLESRAVLEIIKGRLEIVDLFERMVVGNIAETAHRTGDSNLHNLLARFPWILNPEWQVLAEERRITTQLKEWNRADLVDPEDESRYDFLALEGNGRLVVIEIKRSEHPLELDDIQRAIGYAEKLRLAREDDEIITVVIYGGKTNLSKQARKQFETMDLLELRPWGTLVQKSRRHYEKHRALLEGDVQHGQFADAHRELAETRDVIGADSTFRGKQGRKRGLGVQDVEYRAAIPAPETAASTGARGCDEKALVEVKSG